MLSILRVVGTSLINAIYKELQFASVDRRKHRRDGMSRITGRRRGNGRRYKNVGPSVQIGEG